ncbi:hypothetical protein GCM10023158_35130 [Gluconacetobacter tumulicola]
MNTMESSTSHCDREKPTTLVKKAGMITRNAYSDEVLMVRTIIVRNVLGSRHRMEIDPKKMPPTETSRGARREAPCGSRVISSATQPPATTSTSDSQKVVISPTRGIVTLAKREPRVGRLPEKVNQNHPAAEPSWWGGVAAAIRFASLRSIDASCVRNRDAVCAGSIPKSSCRDARPGRGNRQFRDEISVYDNISRGTVFVVEIF